MTLFRGLVLGRDASPAKDARVAIDQSSEPMQDLAYGTDEQGNFTIALPDGSFRLAAHGSDGSRGFFDTEIRGGIPDKALVIRLRN